MTGPGPRGAASKGPSLETRYGRLGIVLILPALLIFIGVVVYPLMSTLVIGFYDMSTATLQGPFVGLGNYREILDSAEFWISLRNNLVWTAGTLTLQVIVGVAVAMMLHQNMAFRALARSLVLFPYLISTVVAVLVWQWLFNDLYGILNTLMILLGIIDVPIDWLGSMPNAMISVILVGAWKYFPFVVIAVLARLQTIPDALYEAATIDGAGPWARFVDVTLPQLRGVLMIVILLRAIWDFKEFDLIYMMTGGGPRISTQTLPLMVYKEAFPLLNMGKAAATAVLMLLVMLVFMVLYPRSQWREDEEV